MGQMPLPRLQHSKEKFNQRKSAQLAALIKGRGLIKKTWIH
jgi:hypothetical protein